MSKREYDTNGRSIITSGDETGGPGTVPAHNDTKYDANDLNGRRVIIADDGIDHPSHSYEGSRNVYDTDDVNGRTVITAPGSPKKPG